MPKGRSCPLEGGNGPFGVWRSSIERPCLQLLVTEVRVPTLADRLSLRERSLVRTCALHPGQTNRLAPLRAAGPCGAGGFQTGLPCGASQPVPPCLGTVARLRPRWRWPSTIRGRDPGGRMPFGPSRPVRLSPPAGRRLDPPASNDAKCSPAGAGFQATYDACSRASRSLEERRLLSSPGGFRGDRTWPIWDAGLCVLTGKGGR